MDKPTILVSGAGIAGAAFALCLARRGFRVRLFERAPIIHEFGAGLQLSPNATAILKRVGVLDAVEKNAVQPQSVVLKTASNLQQVAEVPLGKAAEQRYGSPYLVAHRGDLQTALVNAAKADERIEITTGWRTTGFEVTPRGISLVGECGEEKRDVQGDFLIAADGIWSPLARDLCGERHQCFMGFVAWRRSIAEDDPAWTELHSLVGNDRVNAFLHPKAHLICYPIRSGRAFNLVAFGPGHAVPPQWDNPATATEMKDAFAGAHARLLALFEEAAAWTAWPVWGAVGYEWLHRDRIALIGDAAHAMTPFAAQGAAMGIEDAYTLAAALQLHFEGNEAALPHWQAQRRKRIMRVKKRAKLNRLAWHATGPIAFARDLVLRIKGPDKLLADMDWLYGWKPD
ncbi:FAD-dependent monooxygenase [Limoniibacter endophyticus]|uniref:Salicylate hydroxylase n=1 Tax=Limoniibacter endophyticus TaxID=1565040 RepID=A0A8J3DP83_9HYPH|nr:FAD-dependent monooxygenase [Limoniibacter endophyticus]GHC68499.1 salicylate hydroxylase [Limoniibacter endophyticus]